MRKFSCNENAKPTLSFDYQDIDGPLRAGQVPGALTKYLLSGSAWRMPGTGAACPHLVACHRQQQAASEYGRHCAPAKQGPCQLFRTDTGADRSGAALCREAVLAEFERAANVRFIEVEHSQYNRGDVPITHLFVPRTTTISPNASAHGPGIRDRRLFTCSFSRRGNPSPIIGASRRMRSGMPWG